MKKWSVIVLILVGCSAESGQGGALGKGDAGEGGVFTTEEVVREVIPAQCRRLLECEADAFRKAYPDGLPACEEKGLAGLSEESKGKETTCTRVKLDRCVKDVAENPCEELRKGSAGVPESCRCE